jgi:tetratricopeptide (TPR) repeat protein
MGEVYLRRSLVAAGENKGGETYDLQIKAIGMNPNIANYRRIYSQTNMALAQNILATKDTTDEDKQKAGVLVQQAVREGKAAIALEGLNASYWENLGEIYKKLIGVVDGSPDWAFQALQQASALDPVSPLTKLNLGGLLYSARNFEEADRVFEQVVVNKQDFANGWYNWAYTAKNLNKLEVAIQRLNQALALVPADTGDFDKASKELGEWRKEYDDLLKKQGGAQKTTLTPETLKTAEPIPTAGKEEKVNVPKEQLEPPTSNVVSPTVTVTPTPTEGVTPSPGGP